MRDFGMEPHDCGHPSAETIARVEKAFGIKNKAGCLGAVFAVW